MQTLYKIKEMLWNELDEYANKTKLAAGDVEPIHVLAETIKDICKIDRMTSEMGGKSHDGGMWTANGSYDGRSRNSRTDVNSYENSGRRRHYVTGHYSYDMGGKSAKEKMYHELSEASEYAENSRQREILDRAMRELENT